jgi:DNA-binding NtrC family response regulator
MPIVLESLNLADAERKLCEEALVAAGSIVEAANLLGITRHALKRRILKHQIEWPKPRMSGLPQRPSDSPINHRSAISF